MQQSQKNKDRMRVKRLIRFYSRILHVKDRVIRRLRIRGPTRQMPQKTADMHSKCRGCARIDRVGARHIVLFSRVFCRIMWGSCVSTGCVQLTQTHAGCSHMTPTHVSHHIYRASTPAAPSLTWSHTSTALSYLSRMEATVVFSFLGRNH